MCFSARCVPPQIDDFTCGPVAPIHALALALALTLALALVLALTLALALALICLPRVGALDALQRLA